MAQHEIKIKLKVDDVFDIEDVYKDNDWNGLSIPAYYRKIPDVKEASRPGSSGNENRTRGWKVVFLLAIIGLTNCLLPAARWFFTNSSLMLNQDIRILNSWDHNGQYITPSVAAARTLAASRLQQLTLKSPPHTTTKTIIQEPTLGSSLADWPCSDEANEYKKHESARHLTGEANDRFRRKTGAKDEGCGTNTWDPSLPKLHSLASIGFDPETVSSIKLKPISGIKKSGPLKTTMVLPISISRLHLLESQCRLWKGLPLAAAIYIPLSHGTLQTHPSIDVALAEVLAIAERMAPEGREGSACTLHAEVFIEETCGAALPEPVNALRNRALRLVNTEAVFLADGAHIVSGTLCRALSDRATAHTLKLALQSHPGVVIPGLAPANSILSHVAHHMALEIASTTFITGVINLVKAKQLEGPSGWGLNKTEQAQAVRIWDEHHNKPNTTTLSDGAAPHVLMYTFRVPWFDERLRGVHWSQILHIRQIEIQAGTRNNTWATFGAAWAMRLAPSTEGIGKHGGAEQARINKKFVRRRMVELAEGNYEPAVAMPDLCHQQKHPTRN